MTSPAPATSAVFDGLSSLLILADEAESRVWTKAQMIEQVRDIVGGVYEGLWHDCLVLAAIDNTAT